MYVWMFFTRIQAIRPMVTCQHAHGAHPSVINSGTRYIWMKTANVHLQIFVSYLGLQWLPRGLTLSPWTLQATTWWVYVSELFVEDNLWLGELHLAWFEIRTIKVGRPPWDHPVPSWIQHCHCNPCWFHKCPLIKGQVLFQAYVPFTPHTNLHLSLPESHFVPLGRYGRKSPKDIISLFLSAISFIAGKMRISAEK